MRALILALALFPLAGAALAQSVTEVRFASGRTGTMLSGNVTGRDYKDFRLGAEAGQKMSVELTVTKTEGFGTVYFNVLPPGSDDVAIYIGAQEGSAVTVPLPETGTYTVRVYHMGSDGDSGVRSDFNIDLSLR
ncbi:hypothetical protein [Jannaschia formosa]|uniref:hypothetical protein n=1 Tax=Jannaschia formosa TaxID=2259592 RepID=UPI000E1C39F5|nr:hypothetical protein [Jannaschia formosa]TFL20198.1 hypothetical protein DR046_02310 [Jannaschia formosa]